MDLDLHLELLGETFKLISTVFLVVIVLMLLILKLYNMKNDDRLKSIVRPDFYKFVLIPGIIILLVVYGITIFTDIAHNSANLFYIAIAVVNPLTLYCIYIFYINTQGLSMSNLVLLGSYILSYVFIILGSIFDLDILTQLTTVFTMITIFSLTTNFVLYFFVEIEEKLFVNAMSDETYSSPRRKGEKRLKRRR